MVGKLIVMIANGWQMKIKGDKMKKLITTAKKLIDLPHNKFNLDNYLYQLEKNYNDKVCFRITKETQPIKLMAGNHEKSGIISILNQNQKRKIYIIGKGILFDSGGLDIKHEMLGMTDDKAGMIIALSIANYFKNNVTAYCPVTTNFIHQSKITPGDIIKIGKKNVKITNTDAEGRLILAEALSTLPITKNDIIITIATLTGCCAYAIGTKATAYLTLNEKLSQQWRNASNDANELTWRLPLWDYIEKDYFSKKLIANSNKEIKADTIGAGVFLKQFVKYPNNWIHLDIASSAFDKNGKANGVPIKSLINFINKIK